MKKSGKQLLKQKYKSILKASKKHLLKYNASDVTFGYQFQTFVGIVLMLHYINKMQYIDIEGYKQDVEVKVGNYILYCQAKSCFKPKSEIVKSTKTNWSKQLILGLDLLFEDFCISKDKVSDYLYVVNYPFPLGSMHPENFGIKNYNQSCNYQDLTDDQKDLIINHIKKVNGQNVIN